MKNKNIVTVLFSIVLITLVIGCSSTPEAEAGVDIVINDLIGTWEIEKEFTYKEEGVSYGKARDVLIFSDGATDDGLFLEVQVTITETTPEAPEGFDVGDTQTLYLNETGTISIVENKVTLQAKSPYLNPSTFDFTFEDGSKSKFIWDGIGYNKK